MKKIIIILAILVSVQSFSQEIIGKWKTIDDKTKKVKSVIEIYKEHDVYYGKIIEIFNKDNKEVCKNCTGKYYNKKLQGLEILRDLVKKGKIYDDGNIIDPQNGKTYSCYLELKSDNKLKIRGYIGFSLIGRTQYWYRMTDENQ